MGTEETALRLASSPFRISEFVRKSGPDIGKSIFKQSIVNLGRSLGMTNRVLSKLAINTDGKEITITLPYHGPARGKQSLLRWFVKPDKKKALHWGDEFFSRGHFVTGVDGRFVVERGINQGLAQFRRKIKQETENFLEATKIG